MNENEWLAERFEEHRAHLRAVAYRMLGSLSEADDAVQDTWLRLSRAGAGGVENLGGWLTTIVARVAGANLPVDSMVVRGAAAVARQTLKGLASSLARPGVRLHPAMVNGAAGVIVTMHGQPAVVMGFTIAESKIVEIDSIADPQRVSRIAASVLANQEP
jgi:hypothetical protein